MFPRLRTLALTRERAEGEVCVEFPDDPIWGALMETGEPRFTLVAFGAGDTSIYFDTGGGIIGGGGHESVRRANAAFLRAVNLAQDQLTPTTSFPRPVAGQVIFYARTDHAVLTARADEKALRDDRHPLCHLYLAAHEVLTELRHIEEYMNHQTTRPRGEGEPVEMRPYDDGRISFPVPEDWRASQTRSGDIRYMDPSDEEMWCFVELGGIRPKRGGKPVPSARDFLAGCYEKALHSGEASIAVLDKGRVVVEWPEATTHQGREFMVYHFHLGARTESGELQLADFALAVPKPMTDLPKVSRLREMVREQTRLATFHPWDKT